MTALAKHFDEFLGGRDARPSYYSHIINEQNFDRLEDLLSRTSGTVVYGGDRHAATRYFGPTIVVDVAASDALMSEELFGPILPVLDADLDTAIRHTASREHPLALYGFTSLQSDKTRLLEETMSGGVTFNDCIMHVAAQDAPFGGVGNSGVGYYHGRYGVLAFSHLRTFIDPPTWMDRLMAARYPPYTNAKSKVISPDVRVSFDWEGNDISRGWGLGAFSILVLGIISGVGAVTTWNRK